MKPANTAKLDSSVIEHPAVLIPMIGAAIAFLAMCAEAIGTILGNIL